MATEIEGIKEVTEAILGIGEVAIDNFTFKVKIRIYRISTRKVYYHHKFLAFLQVVSISVHHWKCSGSGQSVLW